MLAIARAVLASRGNLSALLVTCSPLIGDLPMPPGLDYVKLPSARKVGPGEYQARTLGVEHARFRDLRAAVLRETCRSEEHTSELQSLAYLVCRLLLEKKKQKNE